MESQHFLSRHVDTSALSSIAPIRKPPPPYPAGNFLFEMERSAVIKESRNKQRAPFLPSSGPDCSVSVPANSSFWTREEYAEAGLARASHKAVVDQGVMWVIGGYVFNASDYHMVKA